MPAGRGAFGGGPIGGQSGEPCGGSGMCEGMRFGSGWGWKVVLAAGALLTAADGASAQLVPPVLATRTFESLDQSSLVQLVLAGREDEAFELAFEHGDELFETVFNAADGVGANVGNGQRFTRVPRADLAGPGAWARHTPSRTTGPNSQSCNSCHSVPGDDGAGFVNSNVHRDPLHTGRLDRMIQRNTPHVFGMAGVQRLAEEMTEELRTIRADAESRACATGRPVTARLTAKGVEFGFIVVRRVSASPCRTEVSTFGVRGVDADLVVKPFQWKGSVGFVRDFNRGAAHNELGMQAVELVGDDMDGDGDRAVNEFSVGDMTALAVYLAAQPRPTTKLELASLGLATVSDEARAAIGRGRAVFDAVGCAACHVPSMSVRRPIFQEPSTSAAHRDRVFPSGAEPLQELVNPAMAVSFDITRDQPDNVLRDAGGNVTFRLGSFRTDDRGGAVVELFGDLKRHAMGPLLAESIEDEGINAGTFLTENLWGVGSTAPYMHDGRATTLEEAILLHGGESFPSRLAFLVRPERDRKDLIAFLENLVLFKIPEP